MNDKSDVSDCEWLRYLHAVGLLRGSFRPADEVCGTLPFLLRHRDGLVKTASRSVQHMHKAYDQMNVHLHHAISDLSGHTGLAITDAILEGVRDSARLAALADPPRHIDQVAGGRLAIRTSVHPLTRARPMCTTAAMRSRPRRRRVRRGLPCERRTDDRHRPEDTIVDGSGLTTEVVKRSFTP